MAIHLIRHAEAGNRSTWTGSDHDRPLSDEGRAQALTIGEEWAHETPVAVLSSPRLRCLETVRHLADCFELEVQVEPLLDEDTPFERTLALLEETPDGTVCCSHGDVIPAVIDALVRRGVDLVNHEHRALRNGAMFVVHRENGRFVRAELVDPPAG